LQGTQEIISERTNTRNGFVWTRFSLRFPISHKLESSHRIYSAIYCYCRGLSIRWSPRSVFLVNSMTTGKLNVICMNIASATDIAQGILL